MDAMRCSLRTSLLVCLGSWACGGPAPSGDDDPEPPDVAETDVTETDDSDVVVPTDSTPAPVDTAPEVPATRFSGSFVDLSAPWLAGGAHPVAVDEGLSPGYPPGWPPQHGTVFPADVDDDGVLELVVGTAGRSGARRPAVAQVYRSDPGLGGWALDPVASEGLVSAEGFAPLGFVDLDGDGHREAIHADRNVVLRVGGPAGRGPSLPMDLGDARPWNLTLSVMPADVDHDGLLDLLLGESQCVRSLLVWHHTGGGTWSLRDPLGPGAPAQQVAVVMQMPGPDGGHVLLAQGPRCDGPGTHAGFLVEQGTDAQGWPVFVEQDLTGPDASWRSLAFTSGGPYTLAMPMGSAVGDLDLDGRPDLALSLSMWWLVLLHGRADGAFTDVSFDADIQLGANVLESSGQDTPWGVVFVDLDQDGREDVIVATGDDSTAFRYTQGLPFKPSAWWNAGDGSYVDITEEIGLGVVGNWQGLVLADADDDGDADVYLGGWGVPGRFLRNDLVTGHGGFSLQLRGTTSNPYGVGARVEVEVAGMPMATHWMGNAAAAGPVVEPTLFVGLGAARQAERVRVIWPSGTVQEVTGLVAGTRHVLVEPVSLELSEADRHLPAGGSQPLAVQVTPRAPDGGVRPVTEVAVVSRGAPGVVSAVTGPDSQGRYAFTVAPPGAPGSQTLEVVVDGVPMGVRPRVWWD